MKDWFTADLHLNHKNIIKYCNRPFTDIYQMDNVLINNLELNREITFIYLETLALN